MRLCNVRTDRRTDGHTDTSCENNDHYRPLLWVGLVALARPVSRKIFTVKISIIKNFYEWINCYCYSFPTKFSLQMILVYDWNFSSHFSIFECAKICTFIVMNSWMNYLRFWIVSIWFMQITLWQKWPRVDPPSLSRIILLYSIIYLFIPYLWSGF